jgi:hypothetical protein
VIAEFILDEHYNRFDLPEQVGTADVEPEVTIEEGHRFAFVSCRSRRGMFLFVECARSDVVDLERYNTEKFKDFILMDVYAVMGDETAFTLCSRVLRGPVVRD